MNFEGTWVGDDLDERLKEVHDTRSKVKTKPEEITDEEWGKALKKLDESGLKWSNPRYQTYPRGLLVDVPVCVGITEHGTYIKTGRWVSTIE